MWSKLSNLNSKNLTVISIIVVVLAIIAAYFIPQFFYTSDDGLQIGKVIARVRGQAISEKQLASFDKIYNADARHQQKFDQKIQVPSREETIAALKEAVLIEIEATERKITVSDEDMAQRMKGYDFDLYGLNQNQARDLVKMQILRQKIIDVLVGWREFGFITIRFDLMPRNIDLSVFKPKAKTILAEKKTAFNKGKSAAAIAKEIRRDPSFIADFSTSQLRVSPVQFKEPPKKGASKTEDKTFAKADQSLDNHVLDLTAPSVEVWCTDAACYLIKVTAGNEGKYKSLQEWLDKELGN